MQSALRFLLINRLDMGSMIFVVISLIAGLLLLIYFLSRAQLRNSRKKLFEIFANVAAEHKLTFNTKQIFKNRLIAIDRFNLFLLFVDRNSGNDSIHLIDLRQMVFCHIVKQRDQAGKHLSRILIECILKSQETFHLTFFDERFDKADAQLALAKNAERWRKKIRMHQHYSDVLYVNA
jgi:hypothetical protein